MRDPVAIIGMACRYPGAANAQQFWNNLVHAIDVVREPPDDRRDHLSEGIRGGFLEHIDQFDYDFFGISRKEALVMDPQHRLLLETTWSALEDAGIDPRGLNGADASVFVGTAGNEFDQVLLQRDKDPTVISHLGVHPSIIANRLSSQFGLCGKSVSINSACSSSHTAIDLACQEIWLHNTSLAIAAGVNLLFAPYITERLNNSGWLSKQGICRSFDRDSDGYVRGEGIGIVILKPLSEALRHGDRIYSVIRESVVKHNGRGNGLGLPSMQAQIDLLSRIYSRSGIDPDSVEYIEANAVGSTIGDVIELKALSAVLGKKRSPAQPLRIGCLKPNIGHAEGASGMAAVIKGALCCFYRTLPPTIHFCSTVSDLSLDKLGLKVHTSLLKLPQSDTPVRIGVSSFSFGGSNAHLVLEETRSTHDGQPSSCPMQVIELSARSEMSLKLLTKQWISSYAMDSTLSFPEVGFTANLKRVRFPWRLAVVATSMQDFAKKIESDWTGHKEILCYCTPESPSKLGIVFSGNCQLPKKTLLYFLTWQSSYRDLIVPGENIVRSLLGLEIIDIIAADYEPNSINAHLQSFLSEYLVYQLLLSWELQPDISIGYGRGIYSAVFAAGILDLKPIIQLMSGQTRSVNLSDIRPATLFFSSLCSQVFLCPGEIPDSSIWELVKATPECNYEGQRLDPQRFTFSSFDVASSQIGSEDDPLSKHAPQSLSVDLLLTALLRLMSMGIYPNLDRVCCYQNCRVTFLPPAPFETKRVWPGDLDPDLKQSVDPRSLPGFQDGDLSKHRSVTTDHQRELLAIWQEVLNHDNFGVADNFFHIGGSSLLGVTLINRVAQSFGKKLPLSALFQAPTVEELAEIIGQKDTSFSWYSLYPLQVSGSRPPLFGIHGLAAKDLAYHLGQDQPIYCLRYGMGDPHLNPSLPLPGIEELAAHYIDEIRRFWPQGPYFLMGHSLGGVIAYEMAVQLVGAGEPLALLIQFDSYLRTDLQPASPRQILLNIQQIGWPEFRRRTKQKLKRLQQQYGLYGEAEKSRQITRKSHIIFRYDADVLPWQTYVPKPFSGKVLFFKSLCPSILHFPGYPELAWKNYAHGEFDVVEFREADHGSILTEPHVRVVASKITTVMNRLLEGG